MFKWNKILKTICYPHIIIVVTLTAISILGLVYSFVADNAISFLQYLFYIVSAYTLIVVCFRIPNIVKSIKFFTRTNKLLIKYRIDVNFRNQISLSINTTINTLFALFYLVAAIFNKSIWFYSLAIYYMLFLIMRFFLLKGIYKKQGLSLKMQWERYRFCGIVLVILNISFAVITYFVIRHNQGFSYHFIETIAIAFFTFAITISAIIGCVRHRKYHQPIISAIKVVGLSAALVSMFSLQTAMLTVFGSAGINHFKQIITIITGTAVCLFILILGILMIIKSIKEIKKINIGIKA